MEKTVANALDGTVRSECSVAGPVWIPAWRDARLTIEQVTGIERAWRRLPPPVMPEPLRPLPPYAFIGGQVVRNLRHIAPVLEQAGWAA